MLLINKLYPEDIQLVIVLILDLTITFKKLLFMLVLYLNKTEY